MEVAVAFRPDESILAGRANCRYLCHMTWKENISQWRHLTPEEKLRRKWESIPLDVAQSMAFEGEPVPVERIRATLARIEPPALLKPRKVS